MQAVKSWGSLMAPERQQSIVAWSAIVGTGFSIIITILLGICAFNINMFVGGQVANRQTIASQDRELAIIKERYVTRDELDRRLTPFTQAIQEQTRALNQTNLDLARLTTVLAAKNSNRGSTQ